MTTTTNHSQHSTSIVKVTEFQSELRFETLQQLHDRGEELAKSVATAERLTLENEELQTQIKNLEASAEAMAADSEALQTQVQNLESSARDVQQVEKLASEARARVEEEKSELEEQKSKLEEEIKELKAGETNALEDNRRLRIEYDTITQEKKKLQDCFDSIEIQHRENLTKVVEGHAVSVHQLKTEHLREIDKVRSSCNEAHRE